MSSSTFQQPGNVGLPTEAAARLIKFCGMFSSHHACERATAAKMADDLVRSHGLTWGGVIEPMAPKPPSVFETVRWCLRHSEALNEWEAAFVSSLAHRASLSPKQQAKLDQIVEKVHAFMQGI